LNTIREHRRLKPSDKRIGAFAANPINIAETIRPDEGRVCRRGGRETKTERKWLLAVSLYYLSMIFSENWYSPRIKSGAGFFGIML